MILGAIGDDFTGSSDLANTLARSGMATVQYCGLPTAPAEDGVDAGVIALKTRSIAAADAVAQSLRALDWLREQGCRQIVFKYCSTFDSTDAGNIGPVAEALAHALSAQGVVVCPAFPATGRTVYQGHLFVGDVLLSESDMRNHPLTPMTDADLRRVLVRQTTQSVGHVPHTLVRRGPEAVRAALKAGARFMVADAIAEDDLYIIGAACADAPLVTGGSGVALGLAANFRIAGLLSPDPNSWSGIDGPAAALAGSVSQTTRAQVAAHIAAGHPARRLEPRDVMEGRVDAKGLAEFCLSQTPGSVPLVYSSADPEEVATAQADFGAGPLAQALEGVLAATAQALVAGGCRRLITAGGETSGAVVTGLGLVALRIGPEIDPGVPVLSVPDGALHLALKSGNFGAEDFFAKAAALMEASS